MGLTFVLICYYSQVFINYCCLLSYIIKTTNCLMFDQVVYPFAQLSQCSDSIKQHAYYSYYQNDDTVATNVEVVTLWMIKEHLQIQYCLKAYFYHQLLIRSLIQEVNVETAYYSGCQREATELTKILDQMQLIMSLVLKAIAQAYFMILTFPLTSLIAAM